MSFFRKASISTRLVVGFLTILGLMIALTGISIVQVNGVKNRLGIMNASTA